MPLRGTSLLAAVTALHCAFASAAAAQSQSGDGTISAPYTREMALPESQTRFNIINPGRFARPVCARTLDRLMGTTEGSARLPDEVYTLYGDVPMAPNPNRLNFQSVHYTFGAVDGVVLTMSCNVDSDKAVRFAVEAYGRDGAAFEDIRSVVDGHFTYFGNQLQVHDP
jgi:hypothetical protein